MEACFSKDLWRFSVMIILNIPITFFTTCEWQVTLLDILYEMYWLLHHSMLAKLSKLYEIDAACYVLNTELILLAKTSGDELSIGQNKGLEDVWNLEILKPKCYSIISWTNFCLEKKNCSRQYTTNSVK